MAEPLDAVTAIHNAFRRDMHTIDAAALDSARGKRGLAPTVERFRFLNEVLVWHAQGEELAIFPALEAVVPSVAEAYESYDFARAMRRVMAMADRANTYVERMEPWKLKKEEGREKDVQDVSTVALNLFRQIAVYLAPVLPHLAEATGDLLGQPIRHWDEAKTPLTGTPVAKFKPLMQRIDAAAGEAMKAESVQHP